LELNGAPELIILGTCFLTSSRLGRRIITEINGYFVAARLVRTTEQN